MLVFPFSLFLTFLQPDSVAQELAMAWNRATLDFIDYRKLMSQTNTSKEKYGRFHNIMKRQEFWDTGRIFVNLHCSEIKCMSHVKTQIYFTFKFKKLYFLTFKKLTERDEWLSCQSSLRFWSWNEVKICVRNS